MSLLIRNLNKSFDMFQVLKNINLEIDLGEFLVLLGPSGCGKSTLLNCVAGLETIEDGGRILINDMDVTNLAPKDRKIAMVFQSYALYPTMNVRKNITFGLRCRGIPKAEIEDSLKKTVELLQIENLLDRKPATLSGGQRQRVAMGRALVHKPAIFLLDEPMSNLDAKLRTEMRVELKNLHRLLNATIIFVTHDQVEAMSLATRVAVLNQGVFQQVGTPDEIYKSPENRFVAEFIGSPGMNLISGKLAVSSDGISIQREDIRIPVSHYTFREPPEEGRPVTVGIRPERIQSSPSGLNDSSFIILDAEVSNVENLGADLSIFCNYAGCQIISRYPNSGIRPVYGERIRIWADLTDCSIFCQPSGKRL